MKNIEHKLPESNSEKLDSILAMMKEALEIINRMNNRLTLIEIDTAFLALTLDCPTQSFDYQSATIFPLESLNF